MQSRGRNWKRLCATAFVFIVACGCTGIESSGPPPSALVFTPPDIAVSDHEPQLDWHVARWSPRYQIDQEGDKTYLTYHNQGQHHRIPGDNPAGSSLNVIDVTTAQGTQSYMHLTRYSRFLLNYGNVLSSALYVMRGDDAVKITPMATMGFLQAQARIPMPAIYVDSTGDLYVLAPDQIIKVVRDGSVVASGDAKTLALHEPGGLPRFLFLTTIGTQRILCVLKPKMNGIDHVPNEDDFDSKFVIQRP
jgi:hypothetical protein